MIVRRSRTEQRSFGALTEAFVVRQAAMTQARKASARAAEIDAISNRSGDASLGVAEELAALRAIVEGTAHATGEEFFQTLVRHLAEAVDAHYAFVAEF